MRIRLLGGLRVSVGSREVSESVWRLKKAAALVKLLALTPAYALHREQVMETLWPGAGRGSSSNNLRQVLHAARGAFHPDPATASHLLASLGERIVLCPEGNLWVDIEAFEEAAIGARRQREPLAYEAATGLYAGELLPEDRYEEWAEGPRARLRGTYLSLLYELATMHEGRGNLGSAEGVLKKLLAEEPTSEGAHASLMRLYALWGRRGEALSQYEKLENVLSRHLGVEPTASVRALREEISSGRYPPRDAPRDAGSQVEGSPRHNIPTPRTSFVGREREILEAKRELASTHLLMLTGTGGSGKTRLAMEVARDLAGAYPDGVWMVKLAPLSRRELVVQEVASVLGIREQSARPLEETLARHLHDKEALLLLDNCEHLLDSCARLSDLLLGSCPRLKILATSRQALGVEGEVVWRVPSLAVPQRFSPTEELAEYAAVRLFIERARLKLPAFALTERNARAVTEVCRGLEGVPLAVELAAARMGAMAAEHLAEKLDDTLSLLSAGPRSVSPRQQTMRATLEWSHGLLSDKERTAFCRLSVFAGGLTLEAAEAVLPAEGIARAEVLDLVSALVEKSLLAAEVVPDPGTLDGGVGASNAPRYRMLEPVRQYAREKLEESGQAGQTRDYHAAFFLALAEEAEPELRGTSQVAWLERLEREHDNLRAALSWALEDEEDGEWALRLAGALGDFWHVHGYLNEGRRWLEDALAKEDDSPAFVRVKALAHAGYLAWEQIDYEQASALSEECLELSRETGDGAGGASALYVLGALAMFQMKFEEASRLFEEALSLWRELEDDSNVARTLQGLGLVAVSRRDYERAAEIHEESLALAREAGDNLGVILALGQGALAAVEQDAQDLAEKRCREGLELARQPWHPHAIMFILNVWTMLAAAQGQPVRAARLWGAAAALGRTIGITSLAPVEQHHYGPYIEAVRAELGDAAWEAARAEGSAMGHEEAVGYALGTVEPPLLAMSAPEGAQTGEHEGGVADSVAGSGAEASRTRAKALNSAGQIALFQGDERAIAMLDESLTLFRELGDPSGTAAALANLGLALAHGGETERVAALRKDGESMRREDLDRRAHADLLAFLGMAALDAYDYEQALTLPEEALSLYRELDDMRGMAYCLTGLGMTALEAGDPERAKAYFEKSLALLRKMGHRIGVAYCLLGLAGIAGGQGRTTRAARLWGAAEAMRESIGMDLSSPFDLRHYGYEGRLTAARSQLDEAGWEAAWAEGRTMAQEEAIEYALEEISPAVGAPGKPPGSVPSARLTRREKEIADLVARGYTNRRIAEELHLSERTVATYVGRVLKKLDVRTRTEIADRIASDT